MQERLREAETETGNRKRERQREKEDREFKDGEQCPSEMIVASSSQEEGEQSLAWHALNNASPCSCSWADIRARGALIFAPLALLEL